MLRNRALPNAPAGRARSTFPCSLSLELCKTENLSNVSSKVSLSLDSCTTHPSDLCTLLTFNTFLSLAGKGLYLNLYLH